MPVPARVIADPVEKSSRRARSSETVTGQILPYITGAQEELFVSSAYFVPLRQGVDLLGGLADRGVEVTVLTNGQRRGTYPIDEISTEENRSGLLCFYHLKQLRNYLFLIAGSQVNVACVE